MKQEATADHKDQQREASYLAANVTPSHDNKMMEMSLPGTDEETNAPQPINPHSR